MLVGLMGRQSGEEGEEIAQSGLEQGKGNVGGGGGEGGGIRTAQPQGYGK